MLDVVKLGEQATCVRRAVSMEFIAGLLTKIGSIDQKQNASRLGVFDQPIGDGTGRERLARSGGHVDEGSRAVVGEGIFQTGDGFNLAIAHAVRDEWVFVRHPGKPAAKGVGLRGPVGERFGAMECKDTAGAGVRVAGVAKPGFDPSGFVEERKWPGGSCGEKLRKAGSIPA